MAYTEQDLEDVRRAKKGDRAVTFGNRSLQRRSIDELDKLEAEILRDLANQQPRSRRAYGYASKGLG